MEKVRKSDAEWREQLSDEEYFVTRRKGTERAFTGRYWDSKEDGTYRCVACGQPLFSSDAKFDSGTGWPSFYEPAEDSAVETEDDRSFMMRRTEVICSRCDSHLGHVFEDGPEPTGLRYCINGCALTLDKDGNGDE
jgi:peptide-methionine (R)-S-oxide reductase